MSGKIGFLTFTNNQWIIVTEEGRDEVIKYQALVANEAEFPMSRVEKLFETGKRITQVAFGENTWMVLMQEDTATEDFQFKQKIEWSKEFPDDAIKSCWKAKRRIVCLDFLQNQWLLITEEVPKDTPSHQSVATSPEELPGTEIQTSIWDKDKIVTSLSYTKEFGWTMVASPRTNLGQSYSAGSDWPQDKIQDKLAAGMSIAAVAWNHEVEAWAIILNDNPKSKDKIVSTVHFEKSFSEDLMRQLKLVRYGKRF